jgi:hypothetical protein
LLLTSYFPDTPLETQREDQVVVNPLMPPPTKAGVEQDWDFHRRVAPYGDLGLESDRWLHTDHAMLIQCQFRRIIDLEMELLSLVRRVGSMQDIRPETTSEVIRESRTAMMFGREWSKRAKQSIQWPDASTSIRDGKRYLPPWFRTRFEALARSCSTTVPLIHLTLAQLYTDVFQRDREWQRLRGRLQPHVVILLRKRVYTGHVYTWSTADQPGVLYVQGIRASLWWNLMTCGEATRPNVVRSLLEGVRRHAMALGKTVLEVVQPLPIMSVILQHFGFQKREEYVVPPNLPNHWIKVASEPLLPVFDVVSNPLPPAEDWYSPFPSTKDSIGSHYTGPSHASPLV